jgi:hypothetical protein
MEFEIKSTKPFLLTPKEIKPLHISLIIYVQDLHENNYKTVMKEIKEEPRKCSRAGRLTVCQLVSSSQLELQIQCNPVKIPQGFLWILINWF